MGRRTGGVQVSTHCSMYLNMFIVVLCTFNIYYFLIRFLSSPGAYPNFERPYIGNNIKLEIPHFSIWHCIQAPSHRKEHIFCGIVLIFYSDRSLLCCFSCMFFRNNN